ncbi:MAG TPA: DUF3617 family protein [Candidatus Binatia bacterium]|jgi:Spy/CpxP family protein refolding chaperone
MRSLAQIALLALLAAATASPLSAASYIDAPRRKSGLWEIKVSSAQMQGGHVMQQCVDQKTDDLMKPGMEKMSCSKNETRKEGDKLVTESVCKIDDTTVTTRAVLTGRFDSAYKADVKSTYEPPMHGMRESASVVEARWLGPCKAGQKPGDVSMPGMPEGMPNMEELMKKTPRKQ